MECTAIHLGFHLFVHSSTLQGLFDDRLVTGEHLYLCCKQLCDGSFSPMHPQHGIFVSASSWVLCRCSTDALTDDTTKSDASLPPATTSSL